MQRHSARARFAAALTAVMFTAAGSSLGAQVPKPSWNVPPGFDADVPPGASSAAVAPRFAEARVATGVRLRYAEQGDASGDAVILLHGLTDSWFSWSRVLPLLSPARRVIAVELRGHGGSESPASGYLMRDMAADVVALMDALGVRRATVVGHSMGSFVAQQVALAEPARVSGLVLVGTGYVRNDVVRALAAEFDTLSTDPVSAEYARAFQLSTIHGAVPGEFVDRVVAESRKVKRATWRAAIDGMLGTEPVARLGDGRLPMLLLWGDRDQVFARAEQDAVLALSSRATLEVYEATGHALHWEKPVEFARDLERFLSGVER